MSAPHEVVFAEGYMHIGSHDGGKTWQLSSAYYDGSGDQSGMDLTVRVPVPELLLRRVVYGEVKP